MVVKNITNEIILAKKYFSDAFTLEPHNAVFQGFLGDAQLIEGKIFHDKREEVRGYFTLQRAIANWPELIISQQVSDEHLSSTI